VVTSSDKGGSGQCSLVVNSGGEFSDWHLSSVYVWNSHLPDDVFAQVSADLNAQIAGTVIAACAECPAGRFSVDSTRLNCVRCPAGKYKNIAGAQWSFRTDESPYGWQEAYDEAAAAGRRLPTVAELRAYINSNPSVFTQFNGLDRWTPVVNPGVANTKDWVQIGSGGHPRGISHVQDTNNLHGIGYPSWGDSTTHGFAQVYTEVFDACTDCPAGQISAAIGASAASTRCAAGRYQDATSTSTLGPRLPWTPPLRLRPLLSMPPLRPLLLLITTPPPPPLRRRPVLASTLGV
jgi:hypothetical protein